MLKTILGQVKEFWRDSLLTPVFMILEVIMEMVIPLLMAIPRGLWAIYIVAVIWREGFYF